MPPTLLPGASALDLSRPRGPLEVAIQRWQRLRKADWLRARDGSPLADVWLHGKVRDALLLDQRLRRTLGDTWSRVDGARTATWWRPWKRRQAEVGPRITGVCSWQPEQWAACLQVLVERPRRRPLHRLPTATILVWHAAHIHLDPPRGQGRAA